MSPPVYRKGDRVLCPGCGDLIGALSRDLSWGERLSESMLNPDGQAPRSGERMVCRKCGAPYFDGHRFLRVEPATAP